MSKNSSVLDLESITQEEYEVQLYGFSINQFTEENFLFVESLIKGSMKDFKQKLVGTVKDLKPELSDKINKITDEICGEILVNARKDTTKINNIITEKFNIPDNVLLYADHSQAKNTTVDEHEALKNEIEQYEKEAKANAFFIHALTHEMDSYDQLEEAFCTSVFVNNKAEEQLNCNLQADITINNLKKIKDL